MKIYIYQIWFPTSKKSYIGQTRNLQKRMESHLKSGRLVCKALWKYDDWQVTILHTCKTCDEANRIEIEEIRNFNSINPNGYNLTAGGEGGDTFTGRDEKSKIRTIKKLSKILQGNKRAFASRGVLKPGTSRAMKGKKHGLGYKHTEKALEKMRKAAIGNKRSPDINGNKNPSKNPITVLKQQRTKLINHITKLEAEIKCKQLK